MLWCIVTDLKISWKLLEWHFSIVKSSGSLYKNFLWFIGCYLYRSLICSVWTHCNLRDCTMKVFLCTYCESWFDYGQFLCWRLIMTTLFGKAANSRTESNIFQALIIGPSRITESMQMLFHASSGYIVRMYQSASLRRKWVWKH